MMSSYRDTYFFDPQKALSTAKKANVLRAIDLSYTPYRIFEYPKSVERDQTFYNDLQICYYGGDKIFHAPDNLIHLPIENVAEFFKESRFRYPEIIDFDGLDATEETKQEILLLFRQIVDDAENYKNNLAKVYHSISLESSLNFNETLRVFIGASRHTEVMQYIYKNIAEAFLLEGCEVVFEIEKNNMENLHTYFFLKKISQFNPHITININHFNSDIINPDVFNFIWFQDMMPITTNNIEIKIRERDKVFSLTQGIKNALIKKSVNSDILHFMINERLYKPRQEIKKQKKIVFIGSSYEFRINKIKNDPDFDIVFMEAKNIFDEKGCLRGVQHQESEILHLMKKYNKTEMFIQNIYAYLARDYCLEKLCESSSEYDIEIYGNGFEKNNMIMKHYKGKVENGEDVSKIYNSAMYGFCPGGYVLMQRTLECLFSGTTPLVLNTTKDGQDGNYNKNINEAIQFFTPSTLSEILNDDCIKQNKDFSFITEHYGYKSFVHKCYEFIAHNIGKNKIIQEQ